MAFFSQIDTLRKINISLKKSDLLSGGTKVGKNSERQNSTILLDFLSSPGIFSFLSLETFVPPESKSDFFKLMLIFLSVSIWLKKATCRKIYQNKILNLFNNVKNTNNQKYNLIFLQNYENCFLKIPTIKEEHATSFLIILLMIVMMVICAAVYKCYVLPKRRTRGTDTDTESKFRLMESKCTCVSNVHVLFLPDELEHQHEDLLAFKLALADELSRVLQSTL